jgi:hypothetical protein
MKQLQLPLPQSTFERIFNKAKDITDYVVKNPTDLLLALTLVLLIDIESDIDQLEK